MSLVLWYFGGGSFRLDLVENEIVRLPVVVKCKEVITADLRVDMTQFSLLSFSLTKMLYSAKTKWCSSSMA